MLCVGNNESYLLEQRATYQKLNSKSLCCFYGLARLLEWRNAIAIKSKNGQIKKWKWFQKYNFESSLCQQQSVESASKQMQIGSMRALDCNGFTSDRCKKCLHLKRVEVGSYPFTSICLPLVLFWCCQVLPGIWFWGSLVKNGYSFALLCLASFVHTLVCASQLFVPRLLIAHCEETSVRGLARCRGPGHAAIVSHTLYHHNRVPHHQYHHHYCHNHQPKSITHKWCTYEGEVWVKTHFWLNFIYPLHYFDQPSFNRSNLTKWAIWPLLACLASQNFYKSSKLTHHPAKPL